MNAPLQVSPSFLGSVIANNRGDERKIVAVWLEANPGYRQQFVVLTIDQEGRFLKIDLPNTEWKAK